MMGKELLLEMTKESWCGIGEKVRNRDRPVTELRG